ncbi:protein SDA1 homolog [Lineus longissimus]|uniref:protein SDA1 homolog n=1 Tax=Lineus longissimus TaxID=88925 RepID=UPI002B4F95D8
MTNKLPSNLPQLQNLIKRDPNSYKDEFMQQYNHYQSNLQIFLLRPSQYSKTLSELVIFLSQVAHCYHEELSEYPQELRDLLHQHATVLDSDMRSTLCKALILLRNKGLIPAVSVLELFFELFKCQDKLLRKTLYTYIVQDIKNVNAKHKNAKLNTTLQNFMYTMLRDSNAIAAKMSLDVMVELYRRNVWNDSKTVNVITTACFSKVTKILVGALQFFLGRDEADEVLSDSESDSEQKTEKELLLGHRVGKKSKKRQKKLDRALKVLKKNKKKKKVQPFNFSALHLIHDPQGFAEKLFRQLESSNERFEVKVMMINLVSRLIGIHQLFLLNFYPFLQRFLQPHQRDVTKLLTYAAQSCHELVPPDAMEPVMMAVANNFITERNSGEVMAVGLNAVREICARCPLAMDEDLLRDLVQYKNHKDKSVIMAARSLIQLFRTTGSHLLHKKDRGRPTEAAKEASSLVYGDVDRKDYIPGAEVLKTVEEIEKEKQDQDEWSSDSEEEEEADDDSDGWVDVHHSSDEEPEVTEEMNAMAPEDKVAKAKDVTQSRILSQDEFKQIRVRQMAKEMDTDKNPSNKRKREPLDVEQLERGEIVRLDDIERVHKKRAHDYKSRLATVMAGREGREKFGKWKDTKMNPHASTTNKQKKKNQNFMMIKHKVQKKQKRSFRDKQLALKHSLLKKMKNKMR